MTESLVAGRYRLDSLLGRGGMSEVWAATDLELDRRVALKLLAPHEDNARFEREARAVAALAHPNVTQLYDYGEADGRPFMVLEYLPGGSLEDLLHTHGVLADEEVHRIAAEVAGGLAHAHSRGVVHRDLKPSNVLFDEERRAKLSDFGIARMAAGEGTLTEAGTVLGTAAYISPEQASGMPATAASDVYSFGVLLFRMLTGRLPFEADDPIGLVIAHRDAPPPSVTDLRSDAPPALAALTAAALAKDPAARPRDGAALADALAGKGAGEAPTAVTRVMPSPTPALRRRHRLMPVLVAALVILLALGGGVLAYAITRTLDPSPPPTSPRATPQHTRSTPTTTTAPTTATTGRTATTAATTATTATTAPTTTARTTTRHARTTTRPVAPPPPPTTTVYTTTSQQTTTTTSATTTAPTTTG